MTEQKSLRKNPNNPYTNCLLIEKSFQNKIGKTGDFKELYLRCSVQDYFIKLCESKVTRSELLKYLNQGISVSMEIRQGDWDICPGDTMPIQSRIGSYAVIHKIKDWSSALNQNKDVCEFFSAK